MDIYELSPDEFDCSAVKNSFISRGNSEIIIFLNRNETNSDEIISILAENTFLNEYNIVAFGENVPYGEAGYAETMTHPDMHVCALIIKRELFITSGSFNTKLESLSDYEFLVRALKYGRVYFVPVELSGKNTIPVSYYVKSCRTIAYVLRDNLRDLKKDGVLEQVFETLNQYALGKKVSDEYSKELGEVLDNESLYEEMAVNTAPFFIVSGDDTCNGVLHSFAYALAKELVKCGQAVITTDGQYGNSDDFYGGKYVYYKGIIGFQSMALENDIIRGLKAKKLQFWFDHPAFFDEMFKNISNDYYILCQDRFYADYLKKYCHVENALQFPPAGLDAGFKDNNDREYNIVFIGTYNPVNPESLLTDEIRNDFWNYFMDNPKETFERGLEIVLKKYKSDVSKDEFMRDMSVLHPLCKNIINYYRNAVVETILKAGIKLDVFGDTWQQYDGACAENLILHPTISVEESLKVWGHSKIGLNIMSWHKAGMTERIANIMLSGAVCLSDETVYLRDNFDEDKEIVLFQLDRLEKLPEKINMILENDELRKEIAGKAYDKASDKHVWRKSAEDILKLCNE